MNRTGFPIKSIIDEIYIPYFHKHGESAIPFLVNCLTSKLAFLSAYKHLPPIEEMDENEKREMKLYVLSLFPNKTVSEKLEACKIVYTIGTLI